MSGFNPYNDGTGYGSYGGGESGGHLEGGFDNGGGSGFSQSQNDKPAYARQFIVPVTIKMLNDIAIEGGHDGSFFSHGVELSYVRFIGVIREIDDQNETYTYYKIEDGTGLTSVRVWENDTSESQKLNDNGDDDDEGSNSNFKEPKFSSTDYVEIVATIKEFNNKIQLTPQKMSKITDFNEVPYHLLNVAKHFLMTKNGVTLPSSAGGNAKSESLFVSDGNEHNNNNNNNTSNNKNLSLPDRLLNFIKQHSQSMSDGVPMQFMSQELGLSMNNIEEGINKLIDDGRIFSTTDETQYLPL